VEIVGYLYKLEMLDKNIVDSRSLLLMPHICKTRMQTWLDIQDLFEEWRKRDLSKEKTETFTGA